MAPKRLQTYETSEIVVTFDPNVCTHSGNCVRGLPAVFDVRRKRWVAPERAPAAEVAAQIGRCPSGALQCRPKGAGPHGQPTLATPRLTLRPFARDDAPEVQRLAGAREIADTTLAIPHPYPDGAAEAWIETHPAAWGNGTGVTYAITDRERAALIGAIGLIVTPAHALAELGYWVGLPYWNHGYCTEAGRRLVGFAFGTLGLHRVQARHLTRNPASGRVMEKLGMKREGILREATRRSDRFEDLALYAVLASEWKP